MVTEVIASSREADCRRPLAPPWHTLGLFVLLAPSILSGIYAQRRGTPGGQIFRHHAFLFFSISILIFDAVLIAYIWWGVRKSGTRISQLIGGSWSSARKVVTDVGISIGFLVTVGIVTVSLLLGLGPGHAKSIEGLLPRGPLEVSTWIILSMSAGFVEETVFRGYLQTQFTRWGLPVFLAIITQAVFFGAVHTYKGFYGVVLSFAFAILAGILAVWRKSLRPGILGHAILDMLVIFRSV
jgi:membrane protease YdiL (CAAX protease family)